MKVRQAVDAIKERKIYFIIAIAIFILDFVSKYFVDKYMIDDPIKPIIGNLLIFVFTKNYGVAFGMLNNLPPAITSIVEILIPTIVGIAIVLISVFICSLDMKKSKISLISFSFILGGAIGNFVDRLMRGYVTDFINMGFNEQIRFNYNYNIADAFITIGVFMMMIAIIFLKEDISSDNAAKKDNSKNTQNANDDNK